jgi:hypothetical protein
MQPEDRQMVAASLAKIFQGTAGDRAQVRDEVREFGWSELLREWPQDAVTTLFALQGKYLPGTTMLDEIALAQLGFDPEQSAGTGFVFPPIGTHEPVDAIVDVRTGDVRLPRGGLTVAGVQAPARVATVARVDGEYALITGTTDAATWPEADGGLDPDGAWHRFDGELTMPAAGLVVDVALGGRWPDVVAHCHRAIAEELVGVARAMLELALAYTRERHQFGKSMDSFQAVQHKLADVRVWLEIAELSIEAAWEDATPWSATMAKIHAGRLSTLAAKNAQQVLGGMGFTWEHAFHRYLRRAWTLEPVLGSAQRLRRETGDRMRAEGTTPLLAQL